VSLAGVQRSPTTKYPAWKRAGDMNALHSGGRARQRAPLDDAERAPLIASARAAYPTPGGSSSARGQAAHPSRRPVDPHAITGAAAFLCNDRPRPILAATPRARAVLRSYTPLRPAGQQRPIRVLRPSSRDVRNSTLNRDWERIPPRLRDEAARRRRDRTTVDLADLVGDSRPEQAFLALPITTSASTQRRQAHCTIPRRRRSHPQLTTGSTSPQPQG